MKGVWMLALGLAVGGALGFLFGRSTDGPALRGPESPPVATAPNAAARTTENGTAIDEEPAPSHSTPSSRGTGEIRVHVRSVLGKPLPGATVRARPELETPEGPVFQAVTGPDGVATVRGLPPGRFRVAGLLKGWRLRAEGYRADIATAGDQVVLVGRRVGILPVRVVNPDGTAVERAEITCRQGDSHQTEPWGAEDPEIRLGPGTWRLTARTGEDGELGSEQVEAEVKTGGPSNPVEIVVGPRPGIRVRVVYPAATDAYPVTIYALPVDPGAAPDAPVPPGARSRGYIDELQDPTLAVHDVTAGDWVVVAVDTFGRELARRTVAVADRMVTVDLAVPVSDRSEHLDLIVLGPDGERLTDVTVGVGFETESSGSWSGQTGDVLPDGRIRIDHYRASPGDLADDSGRFTVTVTARKYGRKKIEYDPRETSELTVRFDEPATLEVTLGRLSDTGVRSVLAVALVPSGDDPFADETEGEISEEGKVTLGPIPPGQYQLQLGIRRQDHHSAATFESRLVTLGPGRNEETVVLPWFGRLTVLTGAEMADRSFSLQRNSVRHRWMGMGTRKPDGGRVVFDYLPAGEYQVSARGDSGTGRMLVAVEGDTTVRFAPAALDALRVRITDDSGALAAAGLKNDDRIVAIDGTAIEGEEQARLLRITAKEKGPVTVTVLRADEEIELQLDFGRVKTTKEAGGGLLPATR